MSENAIQEKLQLEIPIIFQGAEFQSMDVVNGMVWRRARAVLGQDPKTDETWKGIHEKRAILTHNSRYETHEFLSFKRLSEPLMIAWFQSGNSTIYSFTEQAQGIDVGTFLSAVNRGRAILKLFGEPVELERRETVWGVDEAD